MKTFKRLLSFAMIAIVATSAVACSTGGSKETENWKYTYNTSMSVFPTNWNPHAYQTETDSVVLDYSTLGFYTFDYNDEKNGYKVVPQMALATPVDVTSEYVGQFGIEEDSEERVWKMELRHDLKWDDGTPINALDFVESAKLLLDPQAGNLRADSLYSGDMVVHNAQNYLKQGQSIYEKTSNLYGLLSEAQAAGHTVYLDYARANEEQYLDYKAYFEIFDDEGNGTGVNFFDKYPVSKDNPRIEITEEMVNDYAHCANWAPEADVELATISSLYYTYPEVAMSEVGIIASEDDPYTLTLALDKSLSGFYLLYNLTGSWLVKNDLYKNCVTVKDGVYNNTYGTSVATYASYGPYKLTYFQKDKQIRFEKNPYYFENAADYESDVTLYQTTDIVIDYVAEESTRLNLFLSGKLDTYGLQADDMEDYAGSDYTYYTTGASTFYMAFNPDASFYADYDANHAGSNKSVLAMTGFRNAVSFAIDRASFALATAPTNSAAIAMFSSLIISDPQNGTAYRTTEEAKDVVLNFWGLADQVGEGKKYATKDDAINSITGYDLAGARALFTSVYNEAVAAGILKETDKVAITIGTPKAESSFYNKGYEFISNALTEAVKTTPFEGKLEFTINNTLGNAFADRLRDNTVDMLFGVGWNGSALNPYNLITAYTRPDYQYDPAFNTSAYSVDVVLPVDGVATTLRASLADWANKCLQGASISAVVVDAEGNATKDTVTIAAGVKAESSVRLAIFAACENALLQQYNLIPLIDDASAALKGMQIKYYTEEYIYGVGRGGVRYMTYYYTDFEWNNYVKAQGGTLNYK